MLFLPLSHNFHLLVFSFLSQTKFPSNKYFHNFVTCVRHYLSNKIVLSYKNPVKKTKGHLGEATMTNIKK